MTADDLTNPQGSCRLQLEAAIECLRESQTAFVCELGSTQKELRETRTELKEVREQLKARVPMSPRAIKAWTGLVGAVVSGVVVVGQIVGTSQAKAEAKSQARVVTEQTYDTRADRDRDRSIERAVAAQARADREWWSARVEEAKVRAEQRANMRTPK